MKMKSIIILFAIQLAYNYVSGLECNGPHEFLSSLTPLCPVQCNTVRKMVCLGFANKPSCQCRDGTVRDTNTNKCVHLNECKDYQKQPLLCDAENEVFSEVVSACPPTCNHHIGPVCQAIIRKPSCVCTLGTIRDTVNNKCVRREQCPQKEKPIPFEEKKIVCNGLNEIFREWVSACPSVCPKPGSPPLPEKCLAIILKPSCVCTNGTIKDTINNKCVRPEECPQKEEKPVLFEEKEKIVCNGVNEIFEEWVSACPSLCPRTGTLPVTDAPPVPEKCLAIVHKPSCVCTNGTIRDTLNNRCVTWEECPQIP